MISVVIPSYNRKDCVLALLRDVYRQEGVDFEVIVVDDCSPDGSYEAIATEFPQVTLLRNEKNGGPCVTRNKGVLAANGEFIVGFDSDVTVPDTHLLAKVEKAFTGNPSATGFAFRVLLPDGATDDLDRWWHPVSGEEFASECFETTYFSGTAYAFRRRPMIEAGLFPEILYMHYEEVVLAYRVLDAGGSIYHLPALTALHHAAPTPRRSRIKTFYKTRSQVLLTFLCYPVGRGCGYLIPRLIYSFICAIREKYLPDFVDSLRSAIQLIRQGCGLRQPLRIETWHRLAKLSQKARESIEERKVGCDGILAAGRG